jgi:uncharacterized repeat protein (TIGR03806 family)
MLVAVALLGACGGASAPVDAGPGGEDAGDVDAGVDAGAADAGAPDAGPVVPDVWPRLADGGLGTLVLPKNLTELQLFQAVPIVDGGVQFADDLVPYELSTPLFSDYALKTRAVRITEGAAAYDGGEVLDFPVGTILTKTFSFPADFRQPAQDVRVIETRLLVHQPAGWEAFPYVWNAAQTEATYAPGGRVVDVSFIDADGGTQATSYLVPSKNQCQECHHLKGAGSDQVMVPIGPKARYLNWDTTVKGVTQNQLDRLAARGQLTGLPPMAQRPRAIHAFDENDGTVEERARTYLDINCAHCHREQGTAGETSRLYLDIFNQDPFHSGVCKRPGSAGNDVGGEFDIVPGNHLASILWFRLQTTESGKMMPAIGRSLRHDAGADLVARWIDGMTPNDCSAP